MDAEALARELLPFLTGCVDLDDTAVKLLGGALRRAYAEGRREGIEAATKQAENDLLAMVNDERTVRNVIDTIRALARGRP